jgi:aryl-alcohol dehydrogenase-like predicted oxidoreductase
MVPIVGAAGGAIVNLVFIDRSPSRPPTLSVCSDCIEWVTNRDTDILRGALSTLASTVSPFLTTSSKAFGQPVCRLGLASYGQTSLSVDDMLYAVGRGLNFLNWQGIVESSGDTFSKAVSALGDLRPKVVLSVQFGARTADAAALELKSNLSALGTDYIDVLTLYYVERAEEWDEIISPGGALQYLREAQRNGVVRQIGVTSHQRKLAARMAASGLLDVLMIRYNAAHRGAEQDVFPITQPAGLPLIAYTALRWGWLLRATPGDPPRFSLPRAPDWYRFVLQHPAVSVALAAPQSRAELDENLKVLDTMGPLSDAEYAALAAHGERVRRYAGSFA